MNLADYTQILSGCGVVAALLFSARQSGSLRKEARQKTYLSYQDKLLDQRLRQALQRAMMNDFQSPESGRPGRGSAGSTRRPLPASPTGTSPRPRQSAASGRPAARRGEVCGGYLEQHRTVVR